LSIDAAGVSEGRHVARLMADNAAGTQQVERRSLVVDRTPPGGDIEAVSDESEMTVSWKPGADPELHDGSTGSGARHTTYRYATESGWSAWRATTSTSFTVQLSALGDPRLVELAAVDRAGNASPTVQAAVCGTSVACAIAARSPGARRLARRNRRAANAVKRALNSLSRDSFRRADRALRSFDEALDACTMNGSRPAARTAPASGLTT
jgi:hypothetical protein